MNRQQRRQFNKKNKTNYTKEEFFNMELWAKLRAGNLDVKEMRDIKLFNNMIHIDNPDLAPDGTEVMLNYERIMSGPTKDKTQKYLTWIEENKDRVFHIKRDEDKSETTSLVGLAEDENKWLFDTYADLLYQMDGKWVYLTDIEDKMIAEAEGNPEEDPRTKIEKIL